MLTTYAMETQIKPGRIINTGSEFSLNSLARSTEALRKMTYVRKLVEIWIRIVSGHQIEAKSPSRIASAICPSG